MGTALPRRYHGCAAQRTSAALLNPGRDALVSRSPIVLWDGEGL